MKSTVAMSVFNRPDAVERVLDSVAQVQPKRLLVFADGPRSPHEAEQCAAARAVVDRVDWDCEVRKNYSDVNLGALHRWASGLDWVFARTEEAIILEEDTVPHPSFFAFCEAMLDRYRADERVAMVTGTNFLERWKDDVQSYHFSHWGSNWGFATWRRAWSFYDLSMSEWADPLVRERIRATLADEVVANFQAGRFDDFVNTGNTHNWDIPWVFARLLQGGLTVVPSVNLVSNVGNRDGRGMHPDDPLSNLAVFPMPLPIRFRDDVTVDRDYDGTHIRRTREAHGLRRAAEAAELRSSASQRVIRYLRNRWGRVRKLVG